MPNAAQHFAIDPASEIDRATIDNSPLGVCITIHPSSRIGQHQPAFIVNSLSQLLQRIENEQALLLQPLRLILITANLDETLTYWERVLGLPEAGLSNQPEGIAVGKHLSWGSDPESARSIILLADYIAVGIATNHPLAVTTAIHELGHVHDDFARGLATGFAQPARSLRLEDWGGICERLADITWSEYAAESLAAAYLDRVSLYELLVNDSKHLVGVHNRIRGLILSHKSGQLDFPSLWCRAVSDLSDAFANLGRSTARVSFAENQGEARARFIDPSGDAALWKPVVEHLARELGALAAKNYCNWGTGPFDALEELVALGFQAAGFLPIHDQRGLQVRIRYTQS